jgi:nucleoid DNA-binding protein
MANQAKNAAPVAAPAKPKPLTKNQLKTKLSEDTGLSGKQVASVLEALENVAVSELNRKGVGAFTIPGLMKLSKTVKKATESRQGINPLTKQPMTIAAKPARNVVRARVLKKLKDAVL